MRGPINRKEEKLETERAVIKAKITTLRQQCWQLLQLRSFACTTQQVPTSANNSQHCWAEQCSDVVTCCVRCNWPAWAVKVTTFSDY